MKLRSLVYSAIFAVILYASSEFFLRLGLLFLGYPFFRPSEYIYSRFYPEIREVRSTEIKRGGHVKNVLILGGSVVSSAWTHMESRLDTILRLHYGSGAEFTFFNVAEAGHTSRDNLLKYKMLEDKRFDLVLYYEAINENRANNVPPQYFREDYSHMQWYSDICQLQSHPEMDVTVLLYVLDKVFGKIKDRLKHRVYISHGEVDPQFARYGSEIKTAATYRRNLTEIINIAKRRGDKLFLISYASFFPKNVVLTGERKDMVYFAGCNSYVATPVVMWGRPENVRKGIAVHNRVLEALANEHDILFFDLAQQMPKDPELFCDVCHLSGPGAHRMAQEIAGCIIQRKLLE